MRHRLLFILALLVAAACDDPAQTGVVALFDLQGQRDTGYFAVPYPNELRVTSTGTIDLGDIKGKVALVQQYLDLMAQNALGGFATNGGAFFRFDDLVDPACLPASAADSLKSGASVFWANIDKASAGYGQRIPFEARFSANAGTYIGGNNLALMPVPGFTLAPGTLHAVVVTDGVCDLAGASVQISADFAQIMQEAAPDVPALQRAHTLYAPLRAYLKEQGITGVVSAAVFRTGKPTDLAGAIRKAVEAMPAPKAENLVAAIDSVKYWELRGTYKAPNFQSGTPPYFNPADGGVIKVDSAGVPQVARTESMRFALTVPKGTMPAAGWPVVLYAHGTGGSYRSFISDLTADKLAEVKDSAGKLIANLAVVGIDQNLHGPRGGGLDPELTFFNFNNPAASVHNMVQAGVDNYALLRMVTGLTADKVPWDAKTGSGDLTFATPLKFDATRVLFMGHSQGGITGPVALAHEPEIKGAVLSGAGGGVINSLLYKMIPNVKQLMEQLIQEKNLDRFHPLLTLVQQLLEPAETLNYGRMLQQHTPSGVKPKHVVFTEGVVDYYTPNVTTESLATAAGVPLVGTVLLPVASLDLAGQKPVAGPVAGNISAGGGSYTGGLVQYNSALLSPKKACTTDAQCRPTSAYDYYCASGFCSQNGHFVVFDVKQANDMVSRFLATLARDGTPTIYP